MFDEDYKKFVMGLMKPGDKMDAEISEDEEMLLCCTLNPLTDLGYLKWHILSNKEELGSRANYLAVIHMFIGLAGELGELADCIKKAVIYRKVVDLGNFIEEIGDIGFYTCALAELLPDKKNIIERFVKFYFIEEGWGVLPKFNKVFNCTITFEQCIEQNKRKLSKRYAEGKYTDEQAKARADKAQETSASV